MKKHPDIAVLGGGLTGVSAALELAKSGKDVVIIDQDARLLNRASLRNEGKIHLGLIYANEPSMLTAKLQLQGALTFHSLLAHWLGGKVEEIPVSTPFIYLVANTSLRSAEQLESHYSKLESLYFSQIKQNPTLNYLGEQPEFLYRKSAAVPACFDAQAFSCGFETSERAINSDVMAELLRRAVAEEEKIQVVTGVRIREVTRKNGRMCVQASSSAGVWRQEFDQVVNALWDGRIAIDSSCGLIPKPGWVYRLKYRTIVKLPKHLAGAPSATIVLGRYGDVVIRPDQTAYLSWYPSGLKGWSHELEVPEHWAPDCRGAARSSDALQIASETITAIGNWYPGIEKSTLLQVDSGVICAFGKTDVDDSCSALHGRSDVGVTSENGYHSVDPGKLTTAPLFGQRVAQIVLAQ